MEPGLDCPRCCAPSCRTVCCQCRLMKLRARLRLALPAFARQMLSGRHRQPAATLLDMIAIPQDAPASVACGRSGLPLLAVCPMGHRRTAPFRLLKTSENDTTLLYGRPYRCRQCDSPEVTLFAVESQAELDDLRRAIAGPPKSTRAPTTHPARDPYADFV